MKTLILIMAAVWLAQLVLVFLTSYLLDTRGKYWRRFTAYSKRFHEAKNTAALQLEVQIQGKINAAVLSRSYKKWQQQYHQIDLAPAAACFLGERRSHTFPQRTFGVLGIADQRLIFESGSAKPITIPVAWIHAIQTWWTENQNLTVVVQTGRWEVYHFNLQAAPEIARVLTQTYGIVQTEYRDYGPAEAKLLTQDVYGVWTYQRTIELHLLPDRLVVDWQDLCHLSQIRQIGIFLTDDPDKALLRLEIEDGGRQVIGLELPQIIARGWATTLATYTGIPAEEEVGRKKKDQEYAQ